MWTDVEACIDDTTLDKPYASKLARVSRQGSGNPHRVVQGIHLIRLVWTEGDACLPRAY